MFKHLLFYWFMLLLLYPSVSLANDKLVVAHYRDWGIYSPNYHINDIDAAKITHLVYESAMLQKDGQVTSGDLYADQQYFYPGFDPQNHRSSGSFGQLRKLKQSYPNLKTLISIGGWNRSQHYAKVVRDKDTRIKFIESALAFVKKHNFDGVELNWAYQSITESDGQWLPEEQQNYIKLIKAFRIALNKVNATRETPLLLFVSLEQYLPYLQDLDLKEIYDASDIINLSRNYINSSAGESTRHISALYGQNFSINRAVQFIKSKTGHVEKLLIAIPAFSIGWQGIQSDDAVSSLYAKVDSPSRGSWDSYGAQSGLYARPHLLKIKENSTYHEYWDEHSKAAYLYSNANMGGHFISFESEQAIDAKIDYVNKMQLAGLSISQLHNDSKQGSSIVAQVFSRLYPWLSMKLSLQAFYRDYKLHVQLFVSLTLLISLFMVIRFYRQRTESLTQQQEKKNFNQLQQQLQSISIPLRSTLQLNQRAQKQPFFQSNENSALSISLKLLRQLDLFTQQLLQETRLGKELRQVQSTPFLVAELIDDVLQILQVEATQNVIHCVLELPEKTSLCSDRAYLQQVLLYLLGIALLRQHKASSLHPISPIELQVQLVGQQLQIKITEPNPDKNYSQWQDLISSRKIIQQLQGDLFIEEGESQIVSTINLKQLSSLVLCDKAPQSSVLPEQKKLSEPEYLRLIGDFANQVAVQNSVDHIVEHAYQLLNSTFSQLTVSVLQGNKTLYQEESEKHKPSDAIEVAKLLDYSFVIYDVSQRNSDQVMFVKALVSQINLVREQLCQMVKTPRLLIELYEIASQKEKIEYIQAAKGYSGLYIKGGKEPTYVTMRLRGIKQYFNDNVLLHIHRSYLVNPNKVIAVKQISRMSYVIQLEEAELPVGRSYLPGLRENYPHWFV